MQTIDISLTQMHYDDRINKDKLAIAYLRGLRSLNTLEALRCYLNIVFKFTSRFLKLK